MPDAPSTFRYKRVLLKVSGEVLMGDQPYGIDMKTVADVAQAVAQVRQSSRSAASRSVVGTVGAVVGVGAGAGREPVPCTQNELTTGRPRAARSSLNAWV